MLYERLAILSSLLALSGCASSSHDSPSQAAGSADLVLRAAVYIEADYDDVWSRFTTAEGFADWYSTPCIEFGEAPGDRVAWGADGTVHYEGTLLRLERGAGVTHTFQFQGFGFEEPPSPVVVDIREAGETVLVSLTHDCGEAPETYAMVSPVGWTKALSRLKSLLETGTPMPWPTIGG